jgi:hypothetical protein
MRPHPSSFRSLVYGNLCVVFGIQKSRLQKGPFAIGVFFRSPSKFKSRWRMPVVEVAV